MTRYDKLMSMTGATLIGVADKLGVKVSCNRTRTALKEAKDAVIKRIIAAETSTEVTEDTQAVSIEEPVEVVTDKSTEEFVESVVETTEPVVDAEPVVESEVKTKKTRKKTDAVNGERTIDYVEQLVKEFGLTYKRSRDGVAILNDANKKRLDMWNRKTRIRIYLLSENEPNYKTLDSVLVEDVTATSGAISKQFDISMYVKRDNIKAVIQHLIGC